MVKSSTGPKAEKSSGTAKTVDVAILHRSEEMALNCCIAVRGGILKD
jgi:hypothetical protein